MKKFLKSIIRKINSSKFSCFFKHLLDIVFPCVFSVADFWWYLRGFRKPSAEEVRHVCENVTFIYKSFERQNMAKRLYRNIQRFYPGARVVIADDSKKPLSIQSPYLTILHLPFNSGLSMGLNRALNEVTTPFVFRMDDDELLTPFTQIGKQLRFLEQNPQVDLVGVQAVQITHLHKPAICAKEYIRQPMNNAPKKLLVPHMTKLDDDHYVVGKCANVFLCRTEKMKQIGYDDHIRMIDHNEFFYRAAGHLVSSMDVSAWVFHYHNRFDTQYQTYRSDYHGDLKYIRAKHSVNKASMSIQEASP